MFLAVTTVGALGYPRHLPRQPQQQLYLHLGQPALSGQPVWTDLWDPRVSDAMGHIELSRDRELIVVAPASADFIAKLANGLADDLLSSLCLARRCPLQPRCR